MNIHKELSDFLMKRGLTWTTEQEQTMLLVIEFIIKKIEEGKIKLK